MDASGHVHGWVEGELDAFNQMEGDGVLETSVIAYQHPERRTMSYLHQLESYVAQIKCL